MSEEGNELSRYLEEDLNCQRVSLSSCSVIYAEEKIPEDKSSTLGTEVDN